MARTNDYTTRARLDGVLGSTLSIKLLDYDKNGTEDSGLYEQIRDRAENELDRRLRQVYAVEFPDISGGALDESVSDLTDWIITREIYAHWRPGGEDEKYWTKKIDAEINDLIEGVTELDEDRVAAGAGTQFIALDDTQTKGTTFAGVDTSTSDKKMRGF